MAAFTVKRFEDLLRDISVEIVKKSPQITDLTPGSVLRSIVEGFSSAIEEVSVQTFLGYRRLLNEVAPNAFQFERKSGVRASVSVVFTRLEGTTDPIRIPSGTNLSTEGGEIFLTDASVTIAMGSESSPSVFAVAEEVGSSYNVSTGTIVNLNAVIEGIASVRNPAPASGGLDVENNFDYNTRFQKYIEGLAGSNLAGLEATALAVEGVTNATGQDIIPPVNNVNARVYIDDRSPSGVSDDTLTAVEVAIDGDGTEGNPGARSAGVNVEISRPTTIAVNVGLSVTFEDEVSISRVRELVGTRLALYVNSLDVGENVLVSKILSTVILVPGIVDVGITSPINNIVVNSVSVARLSTVTYS